MADAEFKRCTKCGESKPFLDFPGDRQKRDGLSSHCKCCKRAAYSAYHKANPGKAAERDRRLAERRPDYHRTKRRNHYLANVEKAKEQSTQWRLLNAERVAAASKAWYAANRDRYRAVKRKYLADHQDRLKANSVAYQAANRPALNARSRQWARDNADRHRAHQAKRRASELLATPVWADAESIIAVYAKARALELETGERFHVDHRVPLQSKFVCGLHVAENLEILPELTNRVKGNRHWPDMP